MERFHKTCIEIIKQREYEILNQDEDKIIGIKDGKKICVVLSVIPKFNVDRIEECISLLNKLEIKHAIIIYAENITSVAKTMVENLKEIKLELFNVDELQYNITNHKLVPKHTRLSEEEAAIFKKTQGVKFGSILRTDPVSRFYGYERGDIIKVTSVGGVITYRIVRG